MAKKDEKKEVVVGKVITDPGELSHEEIHQIILSHDFDTNPAKQAIVAKWKERHQKQ